MDRFYSIHLHITRSFGYKIMNCQIANDNTICAAENTMEVLISTLDEESQAAI